MDLDARSLATLDWEHVLARLSFHCRTLAGERAARQLRLPTSREEVARLHALVLEIQRLEEEDRVPVAAVLDIEQQLDAASHGRSLEGPDLASCGSCLAALEALRLWVQRREELCPELRRVVEPMVVDPELLDRLVGSFDERGELSEDMYPELGELRRGVRGLHARIRQTLDELLRDAELAPKLQDRYVTQRGERYVLPVKADARRKGLGIVHDTSGSGETVFVEPAAVVELNNKLKVLESQLRHAVARILAALSALLARFELPIREALAAAVEVDLACARVDLGRELGGVLPALGSGGCIRLLRARHPVLQLRGIAVVPNDLRIDEQRQGLILSGPNTGGKTVALKTLGLAALFTRAGIPFPCAEGSRVDLFTEVLADIGDLQSVEGDLSTFSGHVLVLRELLRRAGPGVLVLLDEVAVGTDPAQGAALARAVIERLVDAGARLAVTTHYTDLKALATSDPRLGNAAVYLEDGRPSYRLEEDAVGLSHAFSTARRLGLDAAVVDRAEALMSEEARRVGSLLEELESARVRALQQERELEEGRRELARQQQRVDEAWERVRARGSTLAEREARQALERVREAEEEVKGLIAALQKNPDLRRAGGTLASIREEAQRLEEASPRARPAPPPPPLPRPLRAGDRVRVASLGKVGRVLGPPRKGRVEVEISGLRSRVSERDCELLDAPRVEPSRPAPVRAGPGMVALRTERNTCDLRGQRAEEALDALDLFLDKQVLAGESVTWILHGHGTGALKEAVRGYLPGAPHVQAWRPARRDEGGDAYTRVEI